MRRDLRRALAQDTAAFAGTREAAADIVPAQDDWSRPDLDPQLDQQAIGRAAGQAVMEALATHGHDARIVVVNVNIQIAKGSGGNTNQFSTAPNTQQVNR